jgi:Flp pilus assembly protein TadD
MMTAEQRERLALAAEEYRAAQLVNVDWPESHLNLGVMNSETGEALLAETSYREALRLDADFARTYVNLADLYRVQSRDEEGEELLRQGLERVPESAELHPRRIPVGGSSSPCSRPDNEMRGETHRAQ